MRMLMHFLPYLLMFALINSCIELEISAPGFPGMMTYFGVSESVVGLTITMNLIGFCTSAMMYGPLSDAYGRRKIMLIGNGILAIGATMCVIAQSMPILLFARFVQGFGAATSAVVVSAIIADSYKTEEASKLYGIMNALFTSLMALAPVIGGLINTSIGWRGNYGVVAGICLISWFLLLAFLPETSKPGKKIHLSAILSEYRILFTSTQFLSAAAVPSLLYACYMAYVAISPFVYMHTLGLGMFAYTLNTALVVACFAASSSLSSLITNFLGVRRTLHAALWTQLLGALLMCLAATEVHFTASMSLFSVGFALIYPIVFARSMEIFPQIKGTASSAIMSLRYLLCAALTALCSQAFNGSILSLALVIFAASLIVLALSLFFVSQQSSLHEA